jgi:hypothetical protein
LLSAALMLTSVVVVLVALALSAFTYLGLERVGQRAWVPLICRAVAWAALGLLLVNLSCSVRGVPPRPLILLDASFSLGAPGGKWAEARDSAGRWGEVRSFGDERLGADTAPTRGRSLLAPALIGAAASGRPVIVVTDGEIEDTREIPPDILSRSGVRIFARDRRPDLAITRVAGPHRISAGDSIPLDVLVQSVGQETPDTVTVRVTAGSTRLARHIVRLTGQAGGRARILVPSARLSAGDHVLQIALGQSRDAEPRTDSRLHIVTVTPTPGVVFLAGPADWDSRFLYRTLREVSQLPVRGFLRLDGSRWRSMTDLRPVSTEEVRRAARRADLLVLKGGVDQMAQGSSARGIWSWPSGESGETQIPGDWYLTAGDAAPLASAFLGQPVDSFPPAIQLAPTNPAPGSWVALSAQLGRRGPLRPAVFGRQEGRLRSVTVVADGLWRWAFRGGSSEQTYRSWVAATASWLLGGVDPAQGRARPVQPVVPNGRPVVFQWIGAGPTEPLSVTWTGSLGPQSDTLHFDGSGRATVWLAPGQYRYRLSGGAAGTVAVEQYSDEFIPGRISLTPHEPRTERPSGRSSAREWLWLFGLCVLALSGEWLARRRLGLR